MRHTSHTCRSSLLLAATLVCAGARTHAQEQPTGETRPAEAPAQEPQEPAPPPARPGGGGAPPSEDAFRMGSPPALPAGTTEEEMWPAATAEGWRKPCLVHWQRSFDDALEVARAEHRPILVAVNMDGEIASEHFAGVRYRDPETAAQMAPYVCVIASVYRHTPRDHDEEGRRVECPRFGTVTCGEHIEAERELYEKYFDGKRISPRHIVLEPDGKETYDVYYSWDTATVFTTFVKGMEGRPEPIQLPERSLLDLTKSADVADREALERAYGNGTRETKVAILQKLVKEHEVDQVEILRSAIFGLDLEVSRLARRALAQCDTEGALDLMAEALKVPLEESERRPLLHAVARLARTSPRARTLAALHSGLSLGSQHIDTDALAELAQQYEASSGRAVALETRADDAEARPDEPGAQLELAEALLARAQEPGERRYAQFFFDDARTAALRAERLGASGPRLDAVLAVTAAELGDLETARTRAVAAVEGGLLHPGDAAAPEGAGRLTPASEARLLQLFAEARQQAIRAAYRAGESWPPEWLSDVNAAYAGLADSPLIDATALVGYQDFLRWIGATTRANAVLDDALRRFPDSPLLHERLRGRLLWEGGPEGLERGYVRRLEEASSDETTQLTWFAGYASLVAAEHHRRRGEFEAAVAAYDHAVDYFRRNLELFPEGRDNCNHFIAMAGAGRARVALERGELDAATGELLAALELRPDSAATPDGLNITPIATAKMLQARLFDAGDEDRAARVQGALDALDPKLLEPPPSEQFSGAGRRGRPRDQGRPGGGR